ncbi:2-C-methyl-D-erythritol 2,4-cyclodiphosphate synthase, chloroplastic-like [Macadamia integrifolia]|uniref:2-C-methyl-D-erythritol 2,4-cyclodiphosphate synthase, chloroplastic-like n=1 Tax=Macadamia integrifolia TaxID=60698 RepID=UPI001C4EA08C|nr:2-C-methyl-D-erythritol 2,4-cyclodiphosphate synthase, chloroplastic-like [Macadamia integrifolia]
MAVLTAHSFYSSSSPRTMAKASPLSDCKVPAKAAANRLSFHFAASSSLRPCNNENHRNPSTDLVSSFCRPLLSVKSPLTVSATASAIEVEEHTTAINPSKTLPFRVGHGFDLHRLEPGYPLIIGGIKIPHDRGCEAHSDGDVLLHCVVDAILGALGLPDIGQIFPDSDPKWKGAASSVFIKEAVRLMNEAGYELGNLDATLILQRPKLSPHKEAIRANLSALLGADPSVVNLKAKTHEKVDSLGENRSIAAHTVVLLMRK